MQKQTSKISLVGVLVVFLLSVFTVVFADTLSEHDKWLQEARLRAEAGDKPGAAVAYYRALQQKEIDPRTRREFARFLIEAEANNHESEHSEILQALEAEVK